MTLIFTDIGGFHNRFVGILCFESSTPVHKSTWYLVIDNSIRSVGYCHSGAVEQ